MSSADSKPSDSGVCPSHAGAPPTGNSSPYLLKLLAPSVTCSVLGTNQPRDGAQYNRVNFHFPIAPLPRGKHQRVQTHVMNRVAFSTLRQVQSCVNSGSVWFGTERMVMRRS